MQKAEISIGKKSEEISIDFNRQVEISMGKLSEKRRFEKKLIETGGFPGSASWPTVSRFPG